jgi:hypothetical protein
MNDHPVESLPPAPDDLWPKVLAVTGKRPAGRMVTLEIPGFSERPLLSALSRAIHLEMRAAGEWAARLDSASAKDLPWFREYSRHGAEEAARLLAIYAALHGCASYLGALDLSPEALKASASRSYAAALRHEQARRPDQRPFPPAPIEH